MEPANPVVFLCALCALLCDLCVSAFAVAVFPEDYRDHPPPPPPPKTPPLRPPEAPSRMFCEKLLHQVYGVDIDD
jgi:hypothetical protein